MESAAMQPAVSDPRARFLGGPSPARIPMQPPPLPRGRFPEARSRRYAEAMNANFPGARNGLGLRAALRSRVLGLVAGQAILATAAAGTWWMLWQMRSVPGPVLHPVAVLWLGAHAAIVAGLLRGKSWSLYAAALACLPCLGICVAAFAAAYERGRVSYGLVGASVLLGTYAVGLLSRRTRDELREWRASREQQHALASSTRIALRGAGAGTWNRGS